MSTLPERRAQTLERLIEAAQPVRKLSALGALVRVRVPAARFEHGNCARCRKGLGRFRPDS
jgi:hypothetical protein